MAIPDFQAIMLPMLRFAADGSEQSMPDVRSTLADQMIDGLRLAQLMIDFNVGVSQAHAYEIKRIDSDYFAEE